MNDIGLVYVGKIIAIEPIEGADFIVSATVICGKGGKWRGIVGRHQFVIGDLCNVYMPDSMIPPNEAMAFMEKHKWRVRMCRFKGAPSEVLIMPMPKPYQEGMNIGDDLTQFFGVTKYFKPIPPNLQGNLKCDFPSFIPKTDEPNYQNAEGQQYLELLHGFPYYITEKADGSSTTAFKYKGEFGLCSRNWELERDENNGYWKVALKYDLENKLPEGYALQWETCGPGIQSNPMGLKELKGFAFSAYKIDEHRYLEHLEFSKFCYELGFPMCRLISFNESFDKDTVEKLGEGTYENGKEREGVVVRSKTNQLGSKPISFKVINLNYEK
jgi:RNA ligase (TIGR02306 family)